MARIVWADPVRDVFLELPDRGCERILQHLSLLKHFPHMYAVRTKGRFRRHRWFLAGNWLVYYRVVNNTVYIRGLWPARIP
jgi:hypothetical protein